MTGPDGVSGSHDHNVGNAANRSKSGSPLARLVHKQDFERVLTTPARTRSAHFAVHHLRAVPVAPLWRHRPAGEQELSTGAAQPNPQVVDDLPAAAPAGCWLGIVVPKRHARRSVTRSLLKRQIRAVMARHAAALSPGLWLVRLRAPYALAQFASAASDSLRSAAQRELEQLIAGVAR